MVDPACSAGTNCTTVTPFSAAIRSSRRGELSNNFNPNGAPGNNSSGSYWGEAYDTDYNTANFGFWSNTNNASGPPSPPPPFRNTASGILLSRAGTPAQGAVLQIYDPTSAPTTVTMINPPTDPRYSAQFNIAGVSGPDTNAGEVPGVWAMSAFSGNLQTTPALPTFNSPVLIGKNSATLMTWGTDPLATPPYPATPMGPPQPCTGGNCDTSQDTTNLYGTNPDQNTPYLTLDTSVSSKWCLVTGRVTDTSGNGLSAISVGVSDPLTHFPAFEKITGTNGIFTLLIPYSTNMNFMVNTSTPTGGTEFTHYYDPHYSFKYLNNIAITPANAGDTQSLGLIGLSPIPPTVLTGSITGIVTSVETTAPLASIPLELRNAQGYILFTTTTDANGDYTFSQLPANSYSITPVTEMRESPVPAKRGPITLTSGAVTGMDFQIRGVPAYVTVVSSTPGTFVMIAKSNIGLTPNPPMQASGKPLKMYTTIIQGDTGFKGPRSSPYEIYYSLPIAVPPDNSYRLACWLPLPQGGYLKPGASKWIGNLAPGESIEVKCQLMP